MTLGLATKSEDSRLSKRVPHDCGPPADPLLKWSFTIPDRKGRMGRMLFLGDQACGSKEYRIKIKAVTSVML